MILNDFDALVADKSDRKFVKFDSGIRKLLHFLSAGPLFFDRVYIRYLL